MRRPDVDPLVRGRVDPFGSRPAAREHQGVDPRPVDHADFEIAVARRNGNGQPCLLQVRGRRHDLLVQVPPRIALTHINPQNEYDTCSPCVCCEHGACQHYRRCSWRMTRWESQWFRKARDWPTRHALTASDWRNAERMRATHCPAVRRTVHSLNRQESSRPPPSDPPHPAIHRWPSPR